jgi:putative MATE family efflux protein
MVLAKFIDIVKESLRGEEQDYTRIGVRRAIVLLSIPMVLEMAMESLFALVDVFFVSRLGVNAVATVGLTESLLTIVYSLAWGLGMGITAVVARRTGEKDPAGAARAALQGILLATALGLFLALPGLIWPERLLGLMGAAPDVIAEGSEYTRLMIGGNVVIMLLFGINAIFRGVGDAAMAMRSLWLANAINIVLCPLLIFGIGPFEGLGVTGAALATLIGRGTGVAYQLNHLFRRSGRVRLSGIPFALDAPVMINMIKVSAGGVAQFVIASASWVFLVRIVSTFGSAAVAGYTIAIRIIIFSLLPSWGMANAASTLVGQNLGAGQPERAARSAWLCGFYNMLFMVSVAVLFWLTAPWLMHFFTGDPVVAAHGVLALRIICLGYFFYGYGMVLAQAFNGAGDTLTPTWMNVICFWMIEIPLAWLLARQLAWGPEGVFASVAISESFLAVLSAWLFFRGKWKLVKV